MNNDLNLTEIDTLGALLAEIDALTKRANAIKDAIKESASIGGPKVVEGALFKATYSEANVETFDKAKFVKAFGEEAYKGFTKVGARFTVKVTSK